MSVYNGAKYLSLAIESIQRQTFVNYEFIIVDDGSSDQSWKILSEYALNDPRIILIKNEKNLGLTPSLNAGLMIARGEYIARQDADDISLPNRLEEQKNYLDVNPGIVLVSSCLYEIDSKGRIVRSIDLNGEGKIIQWHLLFCNYLRGHSQVMFRRKSASVVGDYNNCYKFSQDYDLWTRLLGQGQIKILREKLLQYRRHTDSISTVNFIQQLHFALQVSHRQIKKIIGRPLRNDEIKHLWFFWTVTALPEIVSYDKENIAELDNNIKNIFLGFLNENRDLNYQKINKIKSIIAEKYFKWFVYSLFFYSNKYISLLMIYNSIKWCRFGIFLLPTRLLKEWYQSYCKIKIICMLKSFKTQRM